MLKINRSTLAALGAAAAAGLALLAPAGAQARDVAWSIGIGAPGIAVGVSNAYPVYTAPAPVYVQPAPVYVQPAPVYVQPRPVYYAPPVYVRPAPVYWGPGHGPRGHWHGHPGRGHGRGHGHR